ncbi:hypothetical protein P3G55_24150, partial [Leptospira sp. 96542]|nr:hypothetical protein [Leptospira sp. 96542]
YGTAGEKGTGLGLVVSLDLIREQGGNFILQSEKGIGTKFTIQRRDGDGNVGPGLGPPLSINPARGVRLASLQRPRPYWITGSSDQ